MRSLRVWGSFTGSPLQQCPAGCSALSIRQQGLHPQCFRTGAPASRTTGPLARSFTVSKPSQSTPTPPSRPTFSYRIGASFSGKGRRFDRGTDFFPSDAQMMDESLQDIVTGRPTSGQDAFFVSRTGNSSNVAFGVADGVGGWADQGIDSADFSHGLCFEMAKIARELHSEGKKDLWPQFILSNAYQEIVREGKIKGGGSTACVATGDEEGNLKVANLGDSGFIHFRLNAVHHFSNPQTHAFNTPFQLSVIPPRILALSQIFGGKQLSDSPEDSNNTSHEVRHGDVLIFATDGVWDNVSPHELLQNVVEYMTRAQAWVTGENGITVSDEIRDHTQYGGKNKTFATTLQRLLAVKVVAQAKRAGMNTKRDGPFAKEVQKLYPQENYRGGKIDDICVIVAIVVQN